MEGHMWWGQGVFYFDTLWLCNDRIYIEIFKKSRLQTSNRQWRLEAFGSFSRLLCTSLIKRILCSINHGGRKKKITSCNSAWQTNLWLLLLPLSGKALMLEHLPESKHCFREIAFEVCQKSNNMHSRSQRSSHKGCLWPLHEPVSLEERKFCN